MQLENYWKAYDGTQDLSEAHERQKTNVQDNIMILFRKFLLGM